MSACAPRFVPHRHVEPTRQRFVFDAGISNADQICFVERNGHLNCATVGELRIYVTSLKAN